MLQKEPINRANVKEILKDIHDFSKEYYLLL
jgi:hypothetical protein